MPSSAAFADMPQPAMVLEKSEVYVPNSNVFARSATALLLLLSQLRFAANAADVSSLHKQITTAVKRFGESLKYEGVPSDEIKIAAYALCATADDIVQNLPAEGRHVWLQNSMLSQFFGERTGGVRFFSYLDEVKANPSARVALLELMYDCLALGFEGVHRTTSGGHSQLETIRRDVYDTIRRVKSRENDEISPHWEGEQLPVRAGRFPIPTWVVASLLGAILVAIFMVLRLSLVGDANALTYRMRVLHPDTDLQIGSGAPLRIVRQPDSSVADSLRNSLAGAPVEVVDGGDWVLVRVGNALLFPSGSATVKPAFDPVAKRIADAIEPLTDRVKVEGHTDSVPTNGVRWKSNAELSEARARNAAEVLQRHLDPTTAVTVEGKAELTPIADNATREGRERNRRVEIYIPRPRGG